MISSSGTHLPSRPHARVSHSASALHSRHEPASQTGMRHRTGPRRGMDAPSPVAVRRSRPGLAIRVARQIPQVLVARSQTGSAAGHACDSSQPDAEPLAAADRAFGRAVHVGAAPRANAPVIVAGQVRPTRPRLGDAKGGAVRLGEAAELRFGAVSQPSRTKTASQRAFIEGELRPPRGSVAENPASPEK